MTDDQAPEQEDEPRPDRTVPPDGREVEAAAAELGDEIDPDQQPPPLRSSPEDGYEMAVAAAPEAAATAAAGFVSGLLEAIGLEAEVTHEVEGERAFVGVSGDDLGLLIGRRGQTLDALQELTRTAVQRRLRARVRLLVDVEGYRARRRQSLAEYGRSMAERAKERGTEIELEPMNAYERKIVHDAVAEVEGASSFSEGEEPNRKVIVRSD
jgi:spoIIIJ-associated protein